MKKISNLIGVSALPILSNTIIIVPFMLFVKLSDGIQFISILPFILFYIFRMTGIFFIRGIKTSVNSYTLLLLSLICGGIGSIFAIFGFLYFNFYILAGLFLGLSGAWLPPSNTSMTHYLKKIDQKLKPNLMIIFSFFILLGFCMLVPTQYGLSIPFILYLFMYLFSIYSVKQFPDYKVNSHDLEEASYNQLFLFGIFFVLLFFLRSSRLLFNSVEFEYFVIGLFLTLIILMIRVVFFKNHIDLKIPIHLSSLTIINGAIGNYLFLFSSLYASIVYGTNQLFLMVYLPYVLGMFIGPKLKLKNKYYSLLGVCLGLIIVLITHLFPLGVFIISTFKSNLNTWLTNQYFNASYLPEDKRIWVKYSLQNIGSIVHQFLLMLIISFILTTDKLPITIFFKATSKSNSSPIQLDIIYTWNYIATSLILISIIVYSIISYKKLSQ